MNPLTHVTLLAQAAELAQRDHASMSPISWVYMIAVWGAIIGLNVFCFYNIFKKKL